MAIPVKELSQLIAHKLDTTEQGAMSDLAIVNEAGRFLVSLRTWTFQLRPTTLLGIVNAQSFINMKADFGRFAGPPVSGPAAQRTRVLELRSLDFVNRMRSSINPPNDMDGIYYGALVSSPLALPGGIPTPRLEIWPTPTVSDPNAFSCTYWANWDDIAADTEYVNIPGFVEGLFRHLVRETAAGYESDDNASVWDRMDAIVASKVYEAAVIADSGMQSNLGPPLGGAASLVAQRRTSGWGMGPFYPAHI